MSNVYNEVGVVTSTEVGLVLLMPTDKLVLSETVQSSDKLSLFHLAISAFF